MLADSLTVFLPRLVSGKASLPCVTLTPVPVCGPLTETPSVGTYDCRHYRPDIAVPKCGVPSTQLKTCGTVTCMTDLDSTPQVWPRRLPIRDTCASRCMTVHPRSSPRLPGMFTLTCCTCYHMCNCNGVDLTTRSPISHFVLHPRRAVQACPDSPVSNGPTQRGVGAIWCQPHVGYRGQCPGWLRVPVR
jgi:hypothetical protein